LPPTCGMSARSHRETPRPVLDAAGPGEPFGPAGSQRFGRRRGQEASQRRQIHVGLRARRDDYRVGGRLDGALRLPDAGARGGQNTPLPMTDTGGGGRDDGGFLDLDRVKF